MLRYLELDELAQLAALFLGNYRTQMFQHLALVLGSVRIEQKFNCFALVCVDEIDFQHVVEGVYNYEVERVSVSV